MTDKRNFRLRKTRYPKMNKEIKQDLKAIDFFCGAGGMTYGMRQAGINVLAGIDIDGTCRETYEINNPNSIFIHKDITMFSPSELQKFIAIKKNDDNMIFIGCSPCQFWTKIHTNKEKSKETKNLLIDFQKFIEYYSPGYIVVENVPGIMKNNKEKTLSQFLRFLRKLGYHVSYDILRANEHGVPQTRRRFLLLASRIKKINLPIADENPNLIVRNFLGVQNGFSIISDGNCDKTDFIHITSSLSENNKKRIFLTPPDGGTRMSWKTNQLLQLPAYVNKDNNFRNVYGRIFWDKPAPTITTKFHSLSNGRFGHPEENRALSLREGATLQTFPKTHKFKGSSISKIARQIGNAVPPELARRIGLVIIGG